MQEEGTQPTIRQEIAKPIPATKPARKPNNSTKHQKGDRNGLKLTEPCLSDHTADSATQHIRIEVAGLESFDLNM